MNKKLPKTGESTLYAVPTKKHYGFFLLGIHIFLKIGLVSPCVAGFTVAAQ
jgi:hypothetical protein